MEPETPRVLVEGGPVERRVNHTIAAMVGFMVGVSIGFAGVLKLQHDASVRNCRQIEVVKEGLRETIGEAGRFSTSSPIRTVKERSESAVFYRDALGRLKPRRC